MTHVYRGDRMTAPEFKGPCTTVKRPDGKCYRGRNGNILLKRADGVRFVGLARQLRKQEAS